MSKRYTIMIVPDGGANVRKLSFSRRALQLVLSVSLLFSLVFAFLIYSNLDTKFNQSELERLRVENGEQRQNLQRLVADLDELRQEMVFVAETETRVRQLADLDESPQSIPVAMGGMPDTDSGVNVDDIQKRINQLQLAIDLRRQSQEEVRNLLNDQVSLGRATPKGWPAKGWLTSYFGMRKSPFTGKRAMHEGLDIAANIGTPVTVTADGVVAMIDYSPTYGKMVVVDHGYGYRTLYGHNSKILAKRGQQVKRGDLIAKVGNTGRSTGSHLHYEIQLNGVPIDPRKSL